MYREFKPRACSSAKRRSRGVTLVELLVTLVILSILAAVALPYAEMATQRRKESELRQALRDIRTALDRFNEDYRGGRLSRLADGVAETGYPRELEVLVRGVEGNDVKGGRLRYLRRIPADPFGDPALTPGRQWTLRGYDDPPDALMWNGRDVYDVRSATTRRAADGTPYAQW